MRDNKVIELSGPVGLRDGLSELLRLGSIKLIENAVKEEFAIFLGQHSERRLEDGRQQVVRNGYMPEREVQTGVGTVPVVVPRARDRGDGAIKFTSKLLPPYLRRTKSLEELLPWLYLKGISTNDFGEALSSLLGEGAAGLSSSTISRLKASWEQESDAWRKRSLLDKRYVYIWVDGVHCGVRQDEEKLCILVALGVTDKGQKEVIAIDDGYRESEESWLNFLRDLHDRGMKAPALAIGDGALGFWKAVGQIFPHIRKQRCWQHKSINVLDKLPKSLKDKALSLIHEIWMADTKNKAEKAWNQFVSTFKDKYPKAVETLEKDKNSLLTFYDFPAAHWKSIRTTNPIESTFATVRHRSSRAKGCVSRNSMLALVYRLFLSAQKRWNRLHGFNRLGDVIQGVVFSDGLSEQDRIDIATSDNNSSLAA